MKRFVINSSAACLVILLATVPLAGAASPDIFTLRCASQAGYTWAALAGNKEYDFGAGVCVDGNGQCAPAIFADTPLLSPTAPSVLKAVLKTRRAVNNQSSTAPACSRSTLTDPLGWMGTAVWFAHSAEIVAVNPYANKLVAISPNGVVRTENRSQTLSAFQEFLPARLEYFQDGYLLASTASEVAAIDGKYYARVAKGNFKENSDGTATDIRSIRDMVVLGSDLVAFGSIGAEQKPDARPDNPGFTLGFFHARIERLPKKPLSFKNAKIFLPLEDQRYYLLGHRYITATADGIFFVSMGKEAAKLYQYLPSGQLRLLTALPATYSSLRPLKSNFTGPLAAEAVFDEIETLRLPAGLYGQGRFIYLLTREPDPQAGLGKRATIWLLHQIDPRNDKLLGSIRLPTTANHLTIVPSPSTWYIFEKGRVTGGAQQRIESILRVPADWVARPHESPLSNTASEFVDCPFR